MIAISLLLLTFPRSFYAQDYKQYEECLHPFKCGQNIQNYTYPFWGENRPSYCGLEGFKLSCHNDSYTTIDIGIDMTFRVLHINQSTLAISLSRLDVPNEICPEDFNDSELNETLFYINPNRTEVLHLFSNCPLPIKFPRPAGVPSFRNSSTCMIEGFASSNFYGNETFSLDQLRDLESCKNKAMIPVNVTALEEFRENATMKTQELLSQSFIVNYIFSDEKMCLDCVNSGGLCWSGEDSARTLCLCGDGANQSSCPKPGGCVYLILCYVMNENSFHYTFHIIFIQI